MAQVRDQWTQLVRGADGKPILDKDGQRMRGPNK
jgi:hypothetical protein